MKYILFTTAFSIWMTMYWASGGLISDPQFGIEICRAISFGLIAVIAWLIHCIFMDTQCHHEGEDVTINITKLDEFDLEVDHDRSAE